MMKDGTALTSRKKERANIALGSCFPNSIGQCTLSYLPYLILQLRLDAWHSEYDQGAAIELTIQCLHSVPSQKMMALRHPALQ